MELHFETIVPARLADVFAFFADPANLPRLLEPWPCFRLLAHDGPVRIGGVMWIEERFSGIPVALGFRHSEFRPPFRLAGRMFHGPFSRFEHAHEFDPVTQGVRIRDRVIVDVPWHFGGRVMLENFIAPRLRRAFAIRGESLRRIVARDELRRPPAACNAGSPAILPATCGN